MQGIINFETFLLTGILLNITPGNDTIFILTKSIGQGKKAGIISVLGIATGSLVHTILAAFGLAAVLNQSELVFNAIKYAGAAYLLYMGYQMLKDTAGLNTQNDENSIATNEINYFKIYQDAIITNVLNPKVALFFIAFLPHFINPNFKNSLTPFLILGASFIVTGTIWCLILAIFAATIFSKLKNDSKIALYINRFCGLVLVLLGIKVAFLA
jgi:RhtB (resistance to homoserine/threonine) family protein